MLHLAEMCYYSAMSTILFAVPFVVTLIFAFLMLRQEMH
jgi:hypothetical protein